MLNCREVTTLIASDALVRASWTTRLGVRFHLLMCQHCRRYATQLRAIAAAARKLYSDLPATGELEKSILESLDREQGRR